jgi:hypothetical protein
MAIDPASGSSSPEPFAYFDPDSCSWRMCQASLLEASGESCTTWPRQGTWDLGFVWALPTSGHPTDEIESSSLLPTPSAYESTPTEAYVDEVREHLDDPHTRLYLPGRKWHSQRTLSRIAGALLPTPGANDSTGPEGETRDARREAGVTGGPALRDIAHLLPTPTGRDHKDGAPNENVETNALLGRAVWDLLPTPSASDGTGGRVMSKETFEKGTRPSGAKAELTLRSAIEHKMLPTPVANPDNPGAGGELRAALEHGPGRRNETGVDSWGRPNRGRASLLPTPTSQDARQNALNETEAARNPNTMWATMGRVQSGAHTSQPSPDGSRFSDDPLPGQLTLEDA